LFSSLPSRLRALGELRDGREVLMFAGISAFGAAVPLLTRLPLPRLAALVTSVPPRRRPPSAGEVERLERLVALAPRVGRPLVRGGCLTRGMTLFWFLRRAGLNVELRFGLDPAPSEDTDGHCWLTLDGEPFLEKQDPRPRFTETYRLPLATA
jgi:hypothetical protein